MKDNNIYSESYQKKKIYSGPSGYTSNFFFYLKSQIAACSFVFLLDLLSMFWVIVY